MKTFYEAKFAFHSKTSTIKSLTSKNIDAKMTISKMRSKFANATTNSESITTSTFSKVFLSLSAEDVEHARSNIDKRAYNKRGSTDDLTPKGKKENDKLTE